MLLYTKLYSSREINLNARFFFLKYFAGHVTGIFIYFGFFYFQVSFVLHRTNCFGLQKFFFPVYSFYLKNDLFSLFYSGPFMSILMLWSDWRKVGVCAHTLGKNVENKLITFIWYQSNSIWCSTFFFPPCSNVVQVGCYVMSLFMLFLWIGKNKIFYYALCHLKSLLCNHIKLNAL